MPQDKLAELDEILATKKAEAEERQRIADIKSKEADLRSSKNERLLQEDILPILEELKTNLSERGIACEVRREEGNNVIFAFNPNGQLNPRREQNAHVKFSLGSGKEASVHTSTMYDNSGGMSGGDGAIPLDEKLPSSISDKVMDTVLKTIKR